MLAGLVLGAKLLIPTLEERLRSEAEQALAAALGGEARLGSVDLDLLSLGLDFRDLQVEADDGERRTFGLFIIAGRVDVGWRNVPRLWIGRVRLRGVSLNGPYLYLDSGFTPPARATPGSGSPSFGLTIGQLNLRRGQFELDERSLPLHLMAQGVDIDGLWSDRDRALTGFTTLGLDVEEPGSREPAHLDLAGRFEWSGQRVGLRDLRVVGDELSLDAEVDLDLAAPWTLEGRGELDAALSWIERWAPGAGVEGRLGSDFVLRLGAEQPFAVRGRFNGSAATQGFHARELGGSFGVGTDEVVVDVGHGRLFGAALNGRVRVDLRESRIDGRLEADGLEPALLLDALGTPLPLDGRGIAELRLEGPLEEPLDWQLDGSFAVDPVAFGAGVPVFAAGSLQMAQRRLAVRADEAFIGSARLALDLDIGLESGSGTTAQVGGETTDAGQTLQATLRILEALQVELPEPVRRPLRGRGPISARVEARDGGGFDLELWLQDGSWDGRSFDRAEIDLSQRGSRMQLDRLALVRGAQLLDATGSFDLAATSPVETVIELEAGIQRVQLEQWGPSLSIPDAVNGRVDGRLSLRRGVEGLRGEGELVWTEPGYGSERLEQASSTFEVADDVVHLQRLDVRGEGLDLSAQGRVDLGRMQGTLQIVDSTLRLDGLEAVRAAAIDASGTAHLSGSLQFDREGWSASLPLQGEELVAWGQTLGQATGRADLDADGALIRLREAGEARWEAEAAIDFAEAGLRLDLKLDDQKFELGPGAPAVDLWLTGHAHADGPMDAPLEWNVEANFPAAELWLGPTTLRAEDPVQLTVQGGEIDLAPLVLQSEGAERRLELAAGYRLADDAVRLTLKGEGDAGLLAVWLPDARASGVVQLDVAVGGTSTLPQLNGSLEVEDGRLRLIGFPQTVEHVDVRVELEEQTVNITRLGASLGGGDIDGRGTLSLRSGAGADSWTYGVSAQLDGVRLRVPEEFDATYRGDLDLRGNLDAAVLSGSLTVDRGLYSEDFDVVSLLGIGVREYSASEAAVLPVLTRLDLDVQAEDNVWVRNSLARLETSLNLQLAGTVDRPEVAGRIALLEGGEITFRDVEYQVESGSVEFTELGRIEPYLRLRAKTNVETYDITLLVEGTFDDFRYELTSIPALSQPDIIALLTTGSTLQDLTVGGGGAGFTGDVATNYFAGALTGRFESQLETLLDLERVQINPLLVDGEADPTTRITVGKELADDLFVLVSSDVGRTERQVYQVEWRASRQVRVVANRDTTGGVGGDVQYVDRFNLGRRRRAQAAPTQSGESRPAEPAVTELVAAIEWSGPGAERRREFERLLPLQQGRAFRRSELFSGVDRIRRTLVEEGRIEASIRARVLRDPEAGAAVRVELEIDPGPQVAVQFDGVRKRDERRLRRRLESLWTEALYEVDLYRDSVEAIRDYFHERGYYAADVQLESLLDQPEPSVRFLVDRGRPVAVGELEIVGHDPISEERVRRQMLSRPGSFLNRRQLKPQVLQDDVKAVRNLYRDEGFLDVRVDPPSVQLSPQGNSASIRVRIEPGPQYHVGQVEFAGSAQITDAQLLEWGGLGPGERYSPSDLLEAESRLRAALDATGRPDARVRGRASRVEPGRVDLTFEIEATDSARVEGIDVVGNTRTAESVIRRELQIAEGDLLSRGAMLRSQRRLYQLGIFSNVRIEHQPSGEGLERVVVRVEEAPPIGLSLTAGYDSENGARGGFAVTHENVGGRDRTLSLQGFYSEIQRRIQLVGEDPRLFGAQVPFLFQTGFEEREEIGYDLERRNVAIRFDRNLPGRWNGFLRYNLQRVDLFNIEDALAIREERLSNIQLGDIGLAVVRDGRDDPFLTQSGTFFSLDSRWFVEPLLSEATFSKFLGQYSYYAKLPGGQSIASSVRLGLAEPFGETEQVPLPERFFAGGDSTLRAFPRDELGPKDGGLPSGGEALFLFNQEYRFPIWQQLKGVVFYDAGNVFRTLDAFDLEEIRHGAGGGLRVETPIGPLRFEYGYKLDREPGESRGAFFISIGSAF